MPSSAFIFDLDGTLVDSETPHFLAYQKMFAGYGIDLTESEFVDHWLNRGQAIKEIFAKHDLKNIDIKVARQQKADILKKTYPKSASLMPGALEFLKKSQTLKIPMAVASGSKRDEIEFLLKKSGIFDFFEFFLGLDDVVNNKPAPDMFLEAARRFSLSPADCLAFENSPHGLNAAKQAGFKVIAIPSPYTKHLDFSSADKIVASFDDLDPEGGSEQVSK